MANTKTALFQHLSNLLNYGDLWGANWNIKLFKLLCAQETILKAFLQNVSILTHRLHPLNSWKLSKIACGFPMVSCPISLRSSSLLCVNCGAGALPLRRTAKAGAILCLCQDNYTCKKQLIVNNGIIYGWYIYLYIIIDIYIFIYYIVLYTLYYTYIVLYIYIYIILNEIFKIKINKTS